MSKTQSLIVLLIVALVATPELAQDDKTITAAEAWKLGWPQMAGPYGDICVPQTGATLVR